MPFHFWQRKTFDIRVESDHFSLMTRQQHNNTVQQQCRKKKIYPT